MTTTLSRRHATSSIRDEIESVHFPERFISKQAAQTPIESPETLQIDSTIRAFGLLASLSYATGAAYSSVPRVPDVYTWTLRVHQEPADDPIDSGATDTASAVRRLRDRSGLSWEELARLFGVSRRSVHNWVTGGQLNSLHVERLAVLTKAFSGLPTEPIEARAELRAPDSTGVSRYQRLVQELGSKARRSGPAVLGAIRDGDITTLGTFVGQGQGVNVDHGWPTSGV